MTAELYINDEAVDLDQKSIIALSFAVNTLNELKTLNGNISNRVTLSDTARNRRVLGFVGDTNVLLTNTARKRLLCRYVQNGVEVIPEGVVTVGTKNSKGLGVVVTSGNVDFFELIEGSLQDLDFSDYDHIYSTITVAESRLNREGYIYPVINYGDMTDASSVLDVRNARPAVFVKSLVDKIVKQTGFELVNVLETDERTADQYARMIVPFANDSFIHGQRFIDAAKTKELVVRQSVPRTYTLSSGTVDDNYAYIKFDTVVRDPSGAFSGEAIYTAPGKFVADIQLTIPVAVFATFTSFTTKVRTIELIKKNEFGLVTVLATWSVNIPPGTVGDMTYQNIVIKAQGVLIKNAGIGETYYARYNASIVGGSLSMYVPKPVTLSILSVGGQVRIGENVEIEATLPDIDKTDFLKAVANYFGGIVQTDNQNKTVQIVPFFRIVDNAPEAVDWSDKIVNPNDEANEVIIGDYAQVNDATYKNDNAITPEDYATGKFAIADENLKLTKNLFELPFSSSFDGAVLGGVTAISIKKITTDGGTDMTESTEPRIAMIDFIDTKVTYTAGDMFSYIVEDSVPQTYFSGEGLRLGLMLQEILDRYYPEIIAMLNDQRKKVIPMYLKEPDIAALDFFKPVYLKQYASYFYISKISDYVGERPCKVELIKLY